MQIAIDFRSMEAHDHGLKRRTPHWLKPVAIGLAAGVFLVGVASPMLHPAGGSTPPAAPVTDLPLHGLPDAARLGWDQLDWAVRQVAAWVIRSGDNRQTAFFIVDKERALLLAFQADGRLVSMTPVLLGSAIGDDSVTGIGDRALEDVLPHERTTPAGRFLAELGSNASGEQVVWVDHHAAVSMHAVRALVASERRTERIESPGAHDNRISFGCINVPLPFFEEVVKPVFQQTRAFVYVMPDTKSLEQVFPGLRVDPRLSRQRLQRDLGQV